jgi:hypothetical protein
MISTSANITLTATLGSGMKACSGTSVNIIRRPLVRHFGMPLTAKALNVPVSELFERAKDRIRLDLSTARNVGFQVKSGLDCRADCRAHPQSPYVTGISLEQLVLAAEHVAHRAVGEDLADRVREQIRAGQDPDIARRARG